MNANAAPPPGTRPPVDVASFDRSQLSVYLKDVVTLALENRPEDPIAFASDYLRRVLGGAGAVARAHQYLSLSPHTRRAFTDNALLAFEVLSGDEEGEKPVPGREFNQLIDALLEDAPSAIAERIRDVLRTTDDAEVRWWEFQRAAKACFALRELLEELERLYERRGFTGAGPSRTPTEPERGSARGPDDRRAILEPGCAFEVSAPPLAPPQGGAHQGAVRDAQAGAGSHTVPLGTDRRAGARHGTKCGRGARRRRRERRRFRSLRGRGCADGDTEEGVEGG